MGFLLFGTPDHLMRQFSPESSETTFQWLDRFPLTPRTESIPLAEAAGRVLAADVLADRSLPSEDQCARDGYALAAAATVGASDYSPLLLRQQTSGDKLLPGQAMMVAKGDLLPAGADAVLPLDQASQQGAFLEVMDSIAVGDGVAMTGEECRSDDRPLKGGRLLRAQDLALLSQLERVEVSVIAKPRVALGFASTALEQACDAMIHSLVERDGGTVIKRGTDPKALLDCNADVVMLVGGSGFEEAPTFYNYLWQGDGVQLEIDGVAINPGEGAVLGRAGDQAVFLLPAEPLAAFAAYDLLVSRLLRRLAGFTQAMPYPSVECELSRKIASRIGRTELARVRLEDGCAVPLAISESRILSTSIVADGFVVVPENSEGYPQGARVAVYLYPA